MTAPRFGFVVVYVKDIARAKRFHMETLGLRVEREAPTFVQFNHFALATDERLSAGSEPELYWLVDDAEAARRDLATRGADPSAIDAKPFGKVFSVRAPEGGTRLFIELARNRPSTAASV